MCNQQPISSNVTDDFKKERETRRLERNQRRNDISTDMTNDADSHWLEAYEGIRNKTHLQIFSIRPFGHQKTIV